jgi:predicted nucleotidyltransferase
VGNEINLDYVLQTLCDQQTELRRLGMAHATVFGSVARGEERAESDIDVVVELDENRPMGVFSTPD